MKRIGILVIGIVVLVVLSYRVSYALFTDSASSSNNTFTAAAVFPSPIISPSITPSITPISCTDGQAFAVTHQNITQGTKKDNSPITDPARIDPNKMLGAPDWVSGTGTNFFAMGKNGTLTLAFANPISSTGTDNLKIYEATNGRATYPLEKASIEVSLTGLDGSWTNIGEVTSEPSGDGVNVFDLTSPIKFVRLTETTDTTPHDNSWDGIDVDAIEGNIICEEIN